MRKGFLIRFIAGSIDIMLGFLLCYILHWYLGYYFASRAVVTFQIGVPGSLWKGPIPMILGIIGTYFYTLPFAFFLAFLPEAFIGWSLGKKLLRLRIADQNRKVAERASLWRRLLFKTSGLWGITLALVLGNTALLVLSAAFGLLFFLGFFLSLGPKKLALHDRMVGTMVV